MAGMPSRTRFSVGAMALFCACGAARPAVANETTNSRWLVRMATSMKLRNLRDDTQGLDGFPLRAETSQILPRRFERQPLVSIPQEKERSGVKKVLEPGVVSPEMMRRGSERKA